MLLLHLQNRNAMYIYLIRIKIYPTKIIFSSNYLANHMGDKLLLKFLHEMKVLIYNYLTSEITMLPACVQV